MYRRNLGALAAALSAILSCTSSQPSPLPSPLPSPRPAEPGGVAGVSAARALLERSLDAFGRAPAERLRGYEIEIESRQLRGNWRQARDPNDSTPNPVPATLRYLVDLERPRVLQELYSTSPGPIVFDFLTHYDTAGAWQVDLLRWRTGNDVSRAPSAGSRGSFAGARRMLPHVLVREALALPDAALHLTPDSLGVRFVDPATTQEYTIRFDGATGLPSRVAIASTEAEYHDWRAVDGLMVPYRRVQRAGGIAQSEQRVTRLDLAAALDDARFALPAGYADPPAPGQPRATRIANGVYRLDDMPGGYHAAFVVHEDAVSVLEAPTNAAFTTAALRVIGETASGRPVRRVFVTHHHNDHVGGLDGYVAAGAELVVGRGIEDAVRRQLADSLKPRVRFVVVDARRTFGRGPTRVEALPIPNAHADGNVAFWIPAARVLFQGDLFYIPERGPVPAAFSVTDSLVKALAAAGVRPSHVVGVHGRTGTWGEVQESLRLRRATGGPEAARASGPNTGETYGLASAAIRAGDWTAALAQLRRAESLAPDHPSVVRQLARMHARMGDTAATLATLGRLLPHGLSTRLDADSAFMPYAALPAFRELERQLAANAAPVVRSDTSFRYGGPGMGHEGMTHVVRGGRARFLLGAMREGSARIVEVDAATGATREAVPATPGSFLGMKPDARGRLWVANVLGSAAGANPDRKSELRAYELASGTLLVRHASPEDGRPHLFNDLVVTRDGRVLLTDSDAATVYLLRPGDERLEVLVPSTPDFSGPNGIALSRDERTAYVGHIEGVSAVRLSDGRRTRLRHASGIATSGIDGMYRCDDRLIAIQSLLGHDRIAAFRLSARGDSITSLTTLEQSHPAYGFPATGTIVNDTLHYIARRRPSTAAGDTTSALVLRLPLGRCG